MHPTLALLLTALLLLSSGSAACKCAGLPTVEKSYHSEDTAHFVRARVLSKRDPPSRFAEPRYTLRIQANYKGCPRRGRVVVRTRIGSAACGVVLAVGRSYVLPLNAAPRPFITSCQFIRRFARLTPQERTFLRTRERCCRGRCRCPRSAPRVNCFLDPCSLPETCAVEGAECRSNYCGGCFAEWFGGDGRPVCRAGGLSS